MLWTDSPLRADPRSVEEAYVALARRSFVEPTAELRAEVERTPAFVRDQLGDARSFSLDSPEKRRPRIG